MKTTLKRFLSLLLALTMIFSMVPTAAFAAEMEETEPALVAEPVETTTAPETTEIPTEEPEVLETETPETEEIILEEITPPVTEELVYHYEPCIELDMQLPRVGCEADQVPENDALYINEYFIVPEQILCVRNYIAASDRNGRIQEILPENYVIPEGQYLAAVLEFEGVNENGTLTVFDENTRVVINGTVCPTELLDAGTRIRASYHYQARYIDVYNVALNIPAPVAGEEAVFEAAYALPTGDRYEIGAGEGISTTNGIRWIVGDSQKALKPGDKFESGHYYKALIYIKAGIGCRFAANVDATVSGAVDVYVSPYYSTETYDQYDPDVYRVVVAEFNLEGEYDIYVENGYAYGLDGDLIGSAKPGDVVTLVAGEAPEENFSFEAWEVISNHEPYIFADGDDYKSPTTFIMPEGDVHIQCCFWYTQVEEVNLTLGGYGIGSYVDCLTVTEDAAGIELGYNGRYGTNYAVYDGPKGTPNSLLPRGTVIEADEVYWLVVTLNPVSGYELYNLYQENIKLDGVPASEIYRNDNGSIDVAFLLPAPAALPTGRIAVENGYAYLSDGSQTAQEAPSGALVQLCAVVPDELTETHRFSHWEILKGNVEFDVEDPFASFVMPEGEVALKAVYLPQIWDVYVTMDLPEVGEAPVYTAESLTEGVTIGEISWVKSFDTHDMPMAEGETLAYEQGYRIRIELRIDDEHVFAENVCGYMNHDQSGMYIDEDGNWFLDYYYDTGARKYSITVDGGIATDMDGNVITKAAVKEQFRVTAEVPEGYAFDHWEVTQGRVIIGWPEVWATSPELECYMLEEDVVFQAVFTDLKDVPIMIVDGNGGDLNANYDISWRNNIDMLVRKGYNLFPEDIAWTTSSAAIATVEKVEGRNYWELVFHKPGTVTVTAKDIYGCKDSITITGYYVDAAKKFTVVSDVPSIGLQVGQRAQMKIYGTDTENPLSPVGFDYTVSKEGIVEVQEGWISGIAPGTVTITATLRGDPAGRKVTLKVTVIEPQIESVYVNYTCVNAVEEETVWLDEDTNYNILYVNAEDFADAPGSITLTPKVKNSLGSELQLTKSLLKWTSSNTKVAKLKVNADGTATVTIPKKANGMARIILTANDKAKTEQIFVIHVRDYAPKLAETKFTLDWWRMSENSYVPLNLTESYGNTVKNITVTEYNRVTKQYDVASPNFQVRQEADGSFSIGMFQQPAKDKGTVKASLNVTCKNGKTYTYLISVAIQNKQPKVTLVQYAKLDTFYRDSEAELGQTISTGGDQPWIESVKVVGDNKSITILPGTVTLAFTEAFKNDETAKVDPNVVLEVKCQGYKPIEMKYKVATQTSKVVVISDPFKLTVTPANTSKSVDFRMVDQKTGENLSAYVVKDKVYIPKAAYLGLEMKNNGTPADAGDDYLTATFTDLAPTNKTATYDITIPVRKDTWREIRWSGADIKYTPKTPAISLDKKALTLNTTFTEREDKAIVTLSDTGLNRNDLDFELVCADKGGSKAWNTAQQLSVVCKDGVITAAFKDPGAVVDPAKCKFEAIPELNGMKLPKVSVTVDVKADTSKVRIDYSTVKLNTYMAGYEIFSTDAFMGNDLELLGFKENGSKDVEIWYADGQLHTRLKTNDPDSKYIFELTPKVKDELTGQVVYTPNKLKFTVQTYRNEKITIDMGSYGTLDTLNPDSALYLHVSNLTNAASGYEKVKAVVGQDGHLFDHTVNEYGQITLKLKPGQTYDTSKTYLLRFVYEVFNQTVVSKNVKVKVTQGKYKPTISPPNAQVALASRKTATLRFSVSLTGAAGAKLDADSIKLNTAKTAAALGRAISTVSVVSVSADGRLATVAVTVMHKDYLDIGKKYTLAFDVTPVGNASNEKAQTVSATVFAK